MSHLYLKNLLKKNQNKLLVVEMVLPNKLTCELEVVVGFVVVARGLVVVFVVGKAVEVGLVVVAGFDVVDVVLVIFVVVTFVVVDVVLVVNFVVVLVVVLTIFKNDFF
jgi:hypothetical protein